MAGAEDQAAFDFEVAEKEFFENARGYTYKSESNGIYSMESLSGYGIRENGRGIRFENWRDVQWFFHHGQRPSDEGGSNGGLNFLCVTIKNVSAAGLIKEWIEHLARADSGLRGGPQEIRTDAAPGQCGLPRKYMILETPGHSTPHFSLSSPKIATKSSDTARRLGVLIHGMGDHHFQAVYDRDRPGLDNIRQTLDEDDDVFLAWTFLTLLTYMEAITEPAKKLDLQVDHVAKVLGSRGGPSLSDILHELNTISNEIRASNHVKHQFHFVNIAMIQVQNVMESRTSSEYMRRLQVAKEDMESCSPEILKERIAELRLHIADMKEEIRQKREEERQTREDARQEREEARATKEEQLLEESIRIAKATKEDSRTMRGIAWVTIAFLPATFVSSFFGMNFFNGTAGSVPFDGASRNVWLFFVIAVPISGIVLFIFYFWDEYERKKDEGKLRSIEEAAITSQDNAGIAKSTGHNLELSALPRRSSRF